MSGIVTDQSGNPLEGIDAIICDAYDNIISTTTDENGEYILEGIELGEAGVYFISNSHVDLGEQVITIDESSESLDIQLAKAYSVSGVIYDIEGNPASNIMIYLSNSDGTGYCDVTNEDGEFSIDGLASGDYIYEVYDDDYGVNLTDTITVAEINVVDFDLTMVAVAEASIPSDVNTGFPVDTLDQEESDIIVALSASNSDLDNVMALSGLGDWWRDFSNSVQNGYTNLRALFNKDYVRQNGYYEDITASFNGLKKLESKEGCKCDYNEQVEIYNKMLDDVKQSQDDAKKELDDLKGVVADKASIVLNNISSIGSITIEIIKPFIPGGAVLKFLEIISGINDIYQLVNGVAELREAAPELISEFENIINGCKTTIKYSFDNLTSSINTALAPVKSALDNIGNASDAVNAIAKFRMAIEKANIYSIKEECTRIGKEVAGMCSRMNAYTAQVEKELLKYDKSHPMYDELIAEWLETQDIHDAQVSMYQEDGKTLKAEYNAKLEEWMKIKSVKWNKVLKSIEKLSNAMKVCPIVSIGLDIMSIQSNMKKLKQLDLDIQNEYKECNDTMYKYRVAVQKAVNTKVPECTCKKSIDVVFCIDTTGSMSDDIASVKSRAISMVETLDRSDYDYTISIVLYRDSGDDYVTNFILGYSNNISSIVSSINSITVNGGGDTPEAANTAQMRCLEILKSSTASQKLIITMSDAPGHSVDANGQTMQNVMYWANRLGVRISTTLTGVSSYEAALPMAMASETNSISAPVALAAETYYTAKDYWQEIISSTGGILYYSSSENIVDDMLNAIHKTAESPIIQQKYVINGFTYKPIVFDASKSYAMDDRSIVRYEWDWNNDGIYDYSSTEAVVEYVYKDDYADALRLRVTDNEGFKSVSSSYVVIANSSDDAFLYTNENGSQDLIVCAYNVDDTISVVSGSTESSAVVNINDVMLSVNEFTPTGAIIIKSYGGNDTVNIDPTITQKVYVFGGEGDDTLVYDDSAQTQGNELFIADGMIKSPKAFTDFNAIEKVQVFGSQSADVFEVQASNSIEYLMNGNTPTIDSADTDSLQISVFDDNEGDFNWLENNSGSWDHEDSFESISIDNMETSSTLLAQKLDAPIVNVWKNNNEIAVQWSEIANASGYLLHYSTNEDFNGYTSELFTTDTSFNINDLGMHSQYYFRVKSIGEDGFVNSNWSAISIPDDNEPPFAANDTAIAVFNEAVTVDVLANDTDSENDVLTIISIANVQNGTASIVNNEVVFTPNDNFSGTGSFDYTISDAYDETSTASVTVTVEDPHIVITQDDNFIVFDSGFIPVSEKPVVFQYKPANARGQWRTVRVAADADGTLATSVPAKCFANGREYDIKFANREGAIVESSITVDRLNTPVMFTSEIRDDFEAMNVTVRQFDTDASGVAVQARFRINNRWTEWSDWTQVGTRDAAGIMQFINLDEITITATETPGVYKVSGLPESATVQFRAMAVGGLSADGETLYLNSSVVTKSEQLSAPHQLTAPDIELDDVDDRPDSMIVEIESFDQNANILEVQYRFFRNDRWSEWSEWTNARLLPDQYTVTQIDRNEYQISGLPAGATVQVRARAVSNDAVNYTPSQVIFRSETLEQPEQLEEPDFDYSSTKGFHDFDLDHHADGFEISFKMPDSNRFTTLDEWFTANQLRTMTLEKFVAVALTEEDVESFRFGQKYSIEVRITAKTDDNNTRFRDSDSESESVSFRWSQDLLNCVLL